MPALVFNMEVHETTISGVKLLTPRRWVDARGFFCETYTRQALAPFGITDDFVQDNHVLSHAPGTVRGLHFQTPPHAQVKLVRVVRGRVLDVVVDLRVGSPTFGRHVAVELTAATGNQIYVPVGCAHGLCTLAPDTEVLYKVSDYYAPAHDAGVLWNDPALGIDWPVAASEARLSDKDRIMPCLADLPEYFRW